MTEKRPRPAPGVRLIEVSVKRELTVSPKTLKQILPTSIIRNVGASEENIHFDPGV